MAKVPMPERSGTSLDGSISSQKKEVNKVTKGKVKTAEKSTLQKFGEAFIEDDIADIKSYVISDVIIPAIKNLIFDSFMGSLEMMLFGSTGKTRRNGGKNGSTTYVSYNKFSDNRSRRADDSRSSDRIDYQSIVFEEKADAEEVLDTLRNLIEDYGQATIGDLYDAAGMTPDKNFTKNEEYGWEDLSHATVKYSRDGYFISLPKEKYLN